MSLEEVIQILVQMPSRALKMAPDNPIKDEFLQIFGQQSMALIKFSVEMRSLFTALDTTNMSHN